MYGILQRAGVAPPGVASSRPRPAVALAAAPMGILCAADRLAGGIWPRAARVWMAGFYVALYIIRPWEQLLPALADLHFERIYALCMIAVVLASSGLRLELTLPTVAVSFFLTALGISSLLAVDPTLAWQPFYEFLTLAVFYFVLLLAVRTPYELVFLVLCYIGAMGTYLAKAEWEFFVHGRHRMAMGVRRLIGLEHTLGGPNSLAISIVVSLPMVLFLYSMRKQICARWPASWRKLLTPGLVLYLMLATSALLLTKSRTGAVSFVVFVGLVAIRGKGFTRKLLSVVGGVLLLGGIWLAASEEAQNRIRTIWNPSAGPANAWESAEGRIAGLRAGLQMFAAEPLTGVGPGNYVPYRVGRLDGVPLLSHNLAGEVLGETGILGTGAFCLLVVAILFGCRKTVRLAQSRAGPTAEVLAAFAVACRDSVLLLLFEGLFAHNLLRFNWFWLAAFTVLALRFVRQQPFTASNPWALARVR
jgi:O-antigen ligase